MKYLLLLTLLIFNACSFHNQEDLELKRYGKDNKKFHNYEMVYKDLLANEPLDKFNLKASDYLKLYIQLYNDNLYKENTLFLKYKKTIINRTMMKLEEFVNLDISGVYRVLNNEEIRKIENLKTNILKMEKDIYEK